MTAAFIPDEQVESVEQWFPEGWFMPEAKEPALPKGAAEVALRYAFPEQHRYRDDPVGWIKDTLGEWVWSKQAEVAESVRDNRYTAVQSAHSTGKSWLAARLIAWWLAVHPPGEAFVVTSAPTQPQVEAILWREVERAHRKADLPGYITHGAIPMWKMNGEIVAFGRKPAERVNAEEAMQAFQGIHAKYVLVILDEAGGIPEWLYDAADSLATNEYCRVLAIGNPDNPASHFRKVCKPGSGWNRIRISALDTPNFTGEWVPNELRHLLVSKTWVKERIKRWGKRSPRFISKVLGLFPKVSDDTLISPELIEKAQLRDLSDRAITVAGRYGVDVADTGNDKTVVYLNRAGYIRLALTPEGELAIWSGKDTMQTAGIVARILDADKGETAAVIDSIGVGTGVVARLRERGYPVVGFNAAHKAHRPDQFKNRRSEQWWAVRELFEAGLVDIDPEDEDLAAQLGSIKWSVDSAGRKVIEKKEETKKRLGGESPDRADAFMQSTVPWDHLPPVEERSNDDRVEDLHLELDRVVPDDIMERAL